jgi:hypothetical protein
MAGNLNELLEMDRDALAFYESLPMFVRDQTARHAREIRTIADLSAFANESMRDGLLLRQYRPMFEDETDSDIDFS